MLHSLRQLFIAFLIGLILCPPSMVHAAGIRVDPTAASQNQAGVGVAPNGVPVINIAAPNASGLSHNKFQDFNVGTPGVVLNNSNKIGISQLGGALARNPNLVGRSAASTILNEVTGSSRSNIEGYTEIFGQKANYILASPNGITINGGGFINIPKATLTTGLPRFGADGTLTGLDVTRGDVLVDGAGVNATNIDAFEIISRTAKLNAAVHAKDLSVVTGRHHLSMTDGTVSPLAPDDTPVPTIAIDSTLLGGMYADRILLKGTEAGVGVNLEGVVQGIDHLEITANGEIQIKNKTASHQTLTITSQSSSIETASNSTAVGHVAARKATLTADSKIIITKGQDTKVPGVHADQVTLQSGAIENNGEILADEELALAATAGDIANSGTIQSGGASELDAHVALNNQGAIYSGDRLEIAASKAINNTSGTIHSSGEILIQADQSVENKGRISSDEALLIESKSDDVINHGNISSGGEAAVTANAGFDNRGTLVSDSELNIVADNAVNSGSIHAGGSAGFEVTGTLNNQGEIGSSDGLTLVTNTGDIKNTGSITTEGSGTLISGESVDNGGKLFSQKSLALSAKSFSNSGTVHSEENSSYSIETTLENTKRLSAGDALTITSNEVANTGTMDSGGRGLFQIGNMVFNNNGLILSAGDLVFEGAQPGQKIGSMVNRGTIHSELNTFYHISNEIANSGRLSTGGDLDVVVDTGGIDNSGTIHSGGNGNIRAGGTLTNAGTLLSGKDLRTTASSLSNTGTIHSGGDSTHAFLTGLLNSLGQSRLSADGSLELDVDSGDVVNEGTVYSRNAGSIQTNGGLNNTGEILSDENLTTASAGLLNTGIIHSDGQGTHTSNGRMENQGRLSADGDLDLTSSEDRISNSGTVHSREATTLNAKGDLDNIGKILAVGEFGVTANALRNSGTIHSGGSSKYRFVTDSMVESGGRSSSDGDLAITVSAGGISNEVK